MQELNIFRIYTDILNKNKFRYFTTGAAAAIAYGDPRLTHDIDLVINLNESEIKKPPPIKERRLKILSKQYSA